MRAKGPLLGSGSGSCSSSGHYLEEKVSFSVRVHVQVDFVCAIIQNIVCFVCWFKIIIFRMCVYCFEPILLKILVLTNIIENI